MSLQDYKSFEPVKAKYEIVFIGRSNVGKSTIMRELIGAKVKVGRRPGVTQKPNYYQFGDLLITDMPGYGYMKGVDRAKQERVKDLIVKYFEDNASRIICAVQVVDAKAFAEIVDRWDGRGEIPIDIELNDFLYDLDLDVIVAVNKMDKIHPSAWDEFLDGICDRLHMLPPWNQWIDKVAPIVAKKGDVNVLGKLLRERLRKAGLEKFVNAINVKQGQSPK
ncbi:GTP-binding protein EngB [Methanocella arvoryzae]|uniref:Probable GTP-binding protein EngB n=1 Tax=Methanocella arvoryzae (strain DSM 22066 / NBRC 105507 / MRE50) TaxID=351160 RepID=Q0W4K5_METAR|nr:GTP-binding protein EngB [Methanocella arvoryzae]CAJ36688.1 conserved GTP-binding protein [Methanocella arvoryzae MRE50]